METIKLKLKYPIDEIRYCAYGFRVGEERIVKKSEVSEDEWNRHINNLIFDNNPYPEGIHCSLYNDGFKIYSGMLDWHCWSYEGWQLNPNNASSEFEYDIDTDDF